MHMVHQPVPKVSPHDVERIVRRDFSEEQFETVMGILNEYATGSVDGSPRVQLAVLKLADGNLEALRRSINTANRDYRDVLVAAEIQTFQAFGNGAIAQKSRRSGLLRATGNSTSHG
jgi:hypothetical protein